MWLKTWLFVILVTGLYGAEGLYLTYPADPAHSMAIHWFEEDKEGTQEILYQASGLTEWKKVECKQKKFGSMLLKSCVLLELESDTEYVFQWLNKESLYRFKTLPATLSRPIQIAIGGDAYQKLKPYQKMNARVAKLAPDFVILGGDIAYANEGNPFTRWREFFKEWQNLMVTSEGRMIPIVACVGNHDLSSKTNSRGALFQDLFPYLENQSYGSLEVAGDSLFMLLDTQHIAPIKGAQENWLKATLEKKENFSRKFAVYHIAAYPSIYSYKEKIPKLIRDTWCPVFEKHGILACFENHNHAYKRTYPIRAEKVDPTGVVYIGDGAWSVPPRRERDDRWYLEERKFVQHVAILTLSKEDVKVKIINIEGQQIDEWQPKTAP